MFAGLAFAMVGCDVDGPEFKVDAPAPSIVAFRVSEGPEVGADGEKVRVRLKASVEVWEKGAIELQFDRYLDPRTAARASFCLSSDTAKPKTRDECVAPVDVAPAYDPVTRTIILYLKEALENGTQYQLTIFKPTEGDEETPATTGLRAFDGVAFGRTLTFEFDTRAAEEPDEDLEGPPAFDADCYLTMLTVLGQCQNCHTKDRASPGGVLLDADTAHLNVGRVAQGTQRGGGASSPQANPLVFGTNMPVIEADGPGNSYLLYKALAAVDTADGTLAEGEQVRLQAFISGMPMPAAESELENQAFDESIHFENMKYISRWIAAGAPECAPPAP